jgi:hypothetical protein
VLDIDVREDGCRFAALNRVKCAALADSQMAPLIRTPGRGIRINYRGTGQHKGRACGQLVERNAPAERGWQVYGGVCVRRRARRP